MKISAVIPAYNVESYIADTIYSLLQQSAKVHEIIVVDDGSTDATIEKIRLFNDSRIRLLATNNNGPGPARNLGVLNATGDYIYFLDGDDLASPKLVDTLTEHAGADLVLFSGASARFFPELDRAPASFYSRGFTSYNLVGRSALLKLAQKKVCPSPCLFLARREFLLKNALYFKSIYYEDEEFFPRMLLEAKRVHIIDECLFGRRSRQGSITTQKNTVSHLRGLIENIKSSLRIYAIVKYSDRMLKRALKKRVANQVVRYIYMSKYLDTKVDYGLIMKVVRHTHVSPQTARCFYHLAKYAIR